MLPDKTNNKIKILYLQPSLGIGGAQELRLTVLKYINKEKYDIRLCCLVEKGEIGKEIEKLGFRVDVIGTSERLFNILSFFPIFAYLKQNKFDIVQTALPVPNLYGRLAALFTRVPCIISEEHSYCERYNPRFSYVFKTINFLLSKHTDRIIACSNAVAQRLSKEEKISKNKFLVLHNIIKPQKFIVNYTKDETKIKLGLSPDDTVIGYVGSLTKVKGPAYLLEAFKKILHFYPTAKLLFVGDGPLKKMLKTVSAEKGIGNSVLFMGYRRDVPQILKAIDVFALPSVGEGFGISLIEAMYMGLPCVATDVGGIPEVVKNGGTGILVPPANSEALAKAIKELLDKPELAKRYGAAGKKRVLENFTADRYIEKLENLYDKLLSRN